MQLAGQLHGAMAADGGGTIRSRIKNLLRSPSIKLRRRSGAARAREDLGDKVRAHTQTERQTDGNIQIVVKEASNVSHQFKEH